MPRGRKVDLGRALVIAATWALLPARAFAIDSPEVLPSPTPPSGASGIDHTSPRAYWGRGAPGPFAAGTLELGWAYARPRIAVGWGRPYYRHLSLEGQPLISPNGAGAYLGVKGAVPWLELRTGTRYFAPFQRSLLDERTSHDRLSIEKPDGQTAAHVVLEAEMAGAAPVPGGGPFWVLSVYHVPGIEEGFHMYEESLKVVIQPPWVWRARFGYSVRFGKDDAINVGVAEEVIVNPGRHEYVLRAGVLCGVQVSQNVDVQATFLPVISSPDSLGLAGADFGHLGIRWRFATEASKRRQRSSAGLRN
jgi:hypothetical protein